MNLPVVNVIVRQYLGVLNIFILQKILAKLSSIEESLMKSVGSSATRTCVDGVGIFSLHNALMGIARMMTIQSNI